MNDGDLDRLANSVLDGSASAEERASLARRLSAEPAARERLAAWEQLFETLRRVPRSQPPDGLRLEILQAIRSEPAPAMSWHAAMKSLVARRPAMAVAYATAMGVAVGSIVSLSAVGVMRRDTRTAPVSGTMARPEARTRHVIADARIDLPSAWLETETWAEGGLVGLTARGQSEGPLDLQLAFDGGEPPLVTVRPPGDTASRFVVSPGLIAITGGGSIDFEVRWERWQPATSSVRVVARTGASVDSVTLALAPGAPSSVRGP